jgi:hypothetical protein
MDREAHQAKLPFVSQQKSRILHLPCDPDKCANLVWSHFPNNVLTIQIWIVKQFCIQYPIAKFMQSPFSSFLSHGTHDRMHKICADIAVGKEFTDRGGITASSPGTISFILSFCRAH